MSDDSVADLSRRQMIAAGTTGLLSATAAAPARAAARGRSEAADGTPEQIHLTWGDDPTSAVVVSWASAGQASRPRVRIGQRVIAATERAYTDTLSGTVVWTYHALVDRLRPGATYGYAVTADNDSSAADPFSATFSTAPAGRARFRFTSFGDLATANPAWASSHGQAAYAVGAVETFQPLFHLLNGDLAYANLTPAAQPQVWRDFGNNVQASAANRPWMPVPGNHELELGNDAHGLASYLTRYTLPPNGVDGLDGRWYAFRVGTALFVCLSGDDVAYQDGGGFVAGPAPLVPAPGTGHPPAVAGTSRYVRGYSGGAQTRWLESTLAAARGDASIDWIVVQLHQCACSSAPGGSSPGGAGSDLGVRREWLPLFDRYEVDLVLSGHDHGYERSFPVRGCDTGAGTDAATGAAVDTRRPHPVTTVDSGVFDSSQGTVHLVLGCGGSLPAAAAPRNPETPATSGAPEMGEAPGTAAAGGTGVRSGIREAAVFTRPGRPVPGGGVAGRYTRPAADAVEEATWSARRDGSAGYGIAVFDVNPGSEAGGQTSVTVRYYHAVGADQVSPATGQPGAPTGDYTLFETFTLVRPRSDGRRWHLKE
ncbi:MAG TPA: metallophosphoesterase family protein [Trebonia sp.]|nr:metallophosphoesterase family protein [Trebonia sp.]